MPDERMRDDHGHGHSHSHGPDTHRHRHEDPATMRHQPASRAGPGHNDHHDHLHSHLHGNGKAARIEELQRLATTFVDGFRAAKDKSSYLRLAGIPFDRTGSDGLTLHLVDATITANWQIGTASPAFASRKLVYLPYPGDMIRARETMRFTYVSLTERADVELMDILAMRQD